MQINQEQRLYVLPCGKGYSCLGFDVAERWRRGYLAWLGLPIKEVEIGTGAAYRAYEEAQEAVRARYEKTGERCPTQLTPQLIGLEGKRVEVTLKDETKKRFYVGKSSGWIPTHLEIKNRNSTGGPAAYVPEGATVRVLPNPGR